MRFVLLAACVVYIASVAAFAIMSLMGGVSLKVKLSTVLVILFCMFVDAVISYKYPNVENLVVPKTLSQKLMKISIISDRTATKGYKISLVILSATLFVSTVVWLLRQP